MHRQAYRLESLGEEKLRRLVKGMPVEGAITLIESGLTLRSMPGAPRRFAIVVGPRIKQRPSIDPHALKSPSTAVDEFVRAHRAVLDA